MTNKFGHADFYVDITYEKPLGLTAGPLLTGSEITAQELLTSAEEPTLRFQLPPTKTLPMLFEFDGKIGPGMFLGWRPIKKTPTPFDLHDTGGQFLPLTSKRFEIGGCVVGCEIEFTVTMPHRVDGQMTTRVAESNNLTIIKPGARLSTLKLRVRDQKGQLLPSGLVGIRLRIPRSDSPINDNPENIVKVAVLGESGLMEEEIDLLRGATAEVFVRARNAGYFGSAQKRLQVISVTDHKPNSTIDLGEVHIQIPGRRFEGVIVTTDGKPAVNAKVVLLSRIRPRTPGAKPAAWSVKSKSNTYVLTDDKGHFRLIAGDHHSHYLDFAIQAQIEGKKSSIVKVDEAQDDMRILLPTKTQKRN